MKYTLIPLFFLPLLSDVRAQSLKAAADRLGQQMTAIGFSLSLFALAMVGVFLMLGKKDAAEKGTQAFLGLMVLSLGSSIVNFAKGIGA